MKMPPPHTILVLCLMGFFSGELKGFSVASSKIQKLPLDMAPTSFDDQYSGCVDTMEEKVEGLQRTEFAYNNYASVWKAATDEWGGGKPDGLKREYAIAVIAYTKSKGSLFSKLNDAVRKAGESKRYYLENFQFKSFHFLLTRALQDLTTGGKCYTTYRGVSGTQLIKKPSEKVRFGYFASSSLSKQEATKFGTDTFFTIRTCFGAYIKRFSNYPHEEEVLIPPYELFQVNEFQTSSGGVRITLNSTGTNSTYNCVYVQGNHSGVWNRTAQATCNIVDPEEPRDTCNAGLSLLHADVWMPFLFWGFLLMAGALGTPGVF